MRKISTKNILKKIFKKKNSNKTKIKKHKKISKVLKLPKGWDNKNRYIFFQIRKKLYFYMLIFYFF